MAKRSSGHRMTKVLVKRERVHLINRLKSRNKNRGSVERLLERLQKSYCEDITIHEVHHALIARGFMHGSAERHAPSQSYLVLGYLRDLGPVRDSRYSFEITRKGLGAVRHAVLSHIFTVRADAERKVRFIMDMQEDC